VTECSILQKRFIVIVKFVHVVIDSNSYVLSSVVATTRRQVRADGQETQNGMYTLILIVKSNINLTYLQTYQFLIILKIYNVMCDF
jgi:hypothetical protein